ncbi:MAG: CotH kinase family protein [Saprospiraceae bacterium]|nr:CotH kinase family protein [Saprospiraceae bacterium]
MKKYTFRLIFKPLMGLWMLLFTPLSISSVSAQDFYHIDSIVEYRVYFTQPNWDAILDSLALLPTEPFFVAKRLVINGVSYDSVGAKYKGNSSFRVTNKKNPWHFELDHIRNGQNHQGFKDLKLSNIFQDPSCLREALSYEAARNYMHTPRANFARVYVNDELIGLYTNVEAITTTFCKREFQSTAENPFFKCNAPVNTGTGFRTPNLSFQTADSTKYFPAYELKADFGWNRLVALCDTLNNQPQFIEKILDVDRALWFLAFNNLFVNLDSYSGGSGHNHYLYQDDNGRFNNITWDVNQSFASFKNTGGTPASVDTLTAMQLTPFLHEVNAGRPLIQKLFANPTYRRQYVAHMKTMMEEQFASGRYKTVGQRMQTTIDADVQRDVNKFTTYDAFRRNLYIAQNIAGGTPTLSSFTGIISMMDGRVKFLKESVQEFKNIPPLVTDLKTSPTTPVLNDNIQITAKITGSTNVYLGYRYRNSAIFQKIQMLDNGLNGDGAANDLVFGATIKALSAVVEFYIYAENNVAGIFSPARAEHEFYKINISVNTNLNAGDVVINEIMADNTRTVQNPKGDYADWIELHNRTNQMVSLAGAYFTDDKAVPQKWRLPTNALIPAGGYLVMWCDDDSTNTTDSRPHANFKLSSSGETLILTNSANVIVDSVAFPKQKKDTTWARYPNGVGAFRYLLPTFNAVNVLTATHDLADGNTLAIYPNPTETMLTIESKNTPLSKITLFNTLGQTVLNRQMLLQTSCTLDVSLLSEGIYFLKADNYSLRKVVIRR